MRIVFALTSVFLGGSCFSQEPLHALRDIASVFTSQTRSGDSAEKWSQGWEIIDSLDSIQLQNLVDKTPADSIERTVLLSRLGFVKLDEEIDPKSTAKFKPQKSNLTLREKRLLQYHAAPEKVDWWHYKALTVPKRATMYLKGIRHIRDPRSLPLLEYYFAWNNFKLNKAELYEERADVAEILSQFHSQESFSTLNRLWSSPTLSEDARTILVSAIVDEYPAWSEIVKANQRDPILEKFCDALNGAKKTRDEEVRDVSGVVGRLAELMSAQKQHEPREIAELKALAARFYRFSDVALKAANSDTVLAGLLLSSEIQARRSRVYDFKLADAKRTKPVGWEQWFLDANKSEDSQGWWQKQLITAEGSREIKFALNGLAAYTTRASMDVMESAYVSKQYREAEAGRDLPVREYIAHAALNMLYSDGIELLAKLWRNPASSEADKAMVISVAKNLVAKANDAWGKNLLEDAKKRKGVQEFFDHMDVKTK